MPVFAAFVSYIGAFASNIATFAFEVGTFAFRLGTFAFRVAAFAFEGRPFAFLAGEAVSLPCVRALVQVLDDIGPGRRIDADGEVEDAFERSAQRTKRGLEIFVAGGHPDAAECSDLGPFSSLEVRFANARPAGRLIVAVTRMGTAAATDVNIGVRSVPLLDRRYVLHYESRASEPKSCGSVVQ